MHFTGEASLIEMEILWMERGFYMLGEAIAAIIFKAWSTLLSIFSMKLFYVFMWNSGSAAFLELICHWKAGLFPVAHVK